MPALRIARNSSFSAASSVGKLPRVLMFAQTAMQAFDSIRCVDYIADRRWKREQRHDVFPGASPSLADRRVPLAPLGLKGLEFSGRRLGKRGTGSASALGIARQIALKILRQISVKMTAARPFSRPRIETHNVPYVLLFSVENATIFL